MSPSNCSSRLGRQRGSTVVEALVGMVLALLISSSSLYALSRGARIHHAANLRAAVVDQLRGQIMSKGVALCGRSLPLSVGAATLSATMSCQPYTGVTATFVGVSSAIPVSVPASQAQLITAVVNAPQIGGQLTVSSTQ